MLRRVKKWLGIEGVKIEVTLPEVTTKSEGVIQGRIRLSSMQAQTVSSITLKLIEKYTRGRRKNKMIDEYLLAEEEINRLIEVPEGGEVEFEFEMPFELLRSEMDNLEERNFVYRGLIKTAKALKAVHSEFRLEVEADVVGTALNPFTRENVNLV